MPKGNEMAAITDAALKGEWFYLEEEQPLDRTTPEYYVLRGNVVRSSTKPDVVGTYAIDGEQVAIVFTRRGDTHFRITLRSTAPVFTPATDILQAQATYQLGGDPVEYYGAFVRRSADYASAADVEKTVR